MSTRKERRKEEERKLDELLAIEQSLVPGVCSLCERALMHDPGEMIVPEAASMREFRKVPICFQCHQQLHRLHKNKELARTLNTVAAVKADPQFQKYLRWVSKLPPETMYG